LEGEVHGGEKPNELDSAGEGSGKPCGGKGYLIEHQERKRLGGGGRQRGSTSNPTNEKTLNRGSSKEKGICLISKVLMRRKNVPPL